MVPEAPESGLDLIERMLQLNPKNRISIEEALKHEFFNDVDENLGFSFEWFLKKVDVKRGVIEEESQEVN